MVELRILKLRWGTVLAFLELPPADGGEGPRSGGEASVRTRSPRARSTICQGNGDARVFSKRQVSRLAPRSTSRCTKLAAASRSLNVAVGIDSGGRREVLGMGIGAIRGRDLWISFLRKLARRSLSGVGMPAERRAAHYPLPQLPGPNRIVIQGTSRLRCRRSRDLGVAHLTNLTHPAHHLSVRLQGEPPAQRPE
jgi:hypothetical protein